MFNLEQLQAFVEFFSPAKLALNWLDVLVLSVVGFYAVEGAVVGFLVAFLDLVSFILSFIIGLTLYRFFGSVLMSSFSLSLGFANAAGFFIAAFMSEFFLALFLRLLVYRFTIFTPSQEEESGYWQTTIRVLGIIPGIFSAIVLISFLLTVVVALPFSPLLKKVVFESQIGNFLIERTSAFERQFRDVFGQAAQESLTFMTVNPESEEGFQLKFQISEPKLGEEEENIMLSMVNSERESRGLGALLMNKKLQEVARVHGGDMARRGYFSHYTQEGLSPFDRLARADIVYHSAGENLALAPDVKLAMNGLMESKGHRANILSSTFGQIGIGAIDIGAYGQIFVQVFTD